MNPPYQPVLKNMPAIPTRALISGLLLIPVNAYWITIANDLWASLGAMTATSLFFNAVFNLFLLTVINLLLRKFFPKHAYSQTELLTIYIMLVMLSTVCGTRMMTFLIGTLTYSFWFATPENEYAELFHRYIPSWFAVAEKKILSGFFEGESSLNTLTHLKAWLTPVLFWSSVIFAMYFVFLCLSIIIRKQWTAHDKLSFPIIQVPVQLTAPRAMASRLLWMGFALSAFVEILNGLHYLYPTIPGVPLKTSFGFSQKPWDALGGIKVAFYPFVIGLTYFVPLDLSFSIWFFYLFFKAQQVLAHTGSQALSAFPYTNAQGMGTWITIGIISIWISRRHLSQVWRRFMGTPSTFGDTEEPAQYRVALIGLLLAMAFLVIVLYRAGVPLSLISFYFVVYLLLSIAITRVRAALGPPYHEIILTHPQGLIVDALGTRRIGPGVLTVFAFMYPFNRDSSAHPMPSQLEGFKIAERTGANSRHIMWGIVLALVVSVIASFWSFLHVMYEHGAQARARGYVLGIGRENFGQLTS